MIVFLVIASGYLIGAVKIKGFSLGSSGVLLAALLLGHFGCEIPGEIKEIGLVLFVASVGVIAGGEFFRRIGSGSLSYLLIGVVTIAVGAAVCVGIIVLLDVPTPLAAGMMTGALTSTPGLAAAVEATGDHAASVGYGIAYPFGVIGVVIFVQLMPRIVKKDKNAAIGGLDISLSAKFSSVAEREAKREAERGAKIKGGLIEIEKNGLFALALAVIAGVVIGDASLPLPGGGSFSLGNSGGPLLSGLVIGHFGRIGSIDVRVSKKTAGIMRELGMILFLAGAGLDAGNGLADIVRENGIKLLFFGALITAVPMLVSYFIGRRLLKLELMKALGSICGGMTSTPALGALLDSSEEEESVTEAYATTYPVALVCVILCCQIIGIVF